MMRHLFFLTPLLAPAILPTFRDVTGESPGDFRARQRAATHDLEPVPPCFVSAAHRPDLITAVSEKRRLEEDAKATPRKLEVP